ncbi:MAG: hypothetical protein GOV02_01020 [Candidatus Aenigmarchaeota archaeon]|nr:hypothetical protein [Candidatus Aenigmarchaeota archaeon]
MFKVGLFGKKKTKEEIALERSEEKKKKQLEEVTKLRRIEVPKTREVGLRMRPASYTKFLTEIKKEPITKYEKACALAEKILPIGVSENMEKKWTKHLRTAFINATPKGGIALTLLTGIFLTLIFILSVIVGAGSAFGLFYLFFALIAIWYVYSYPGNRSKIMDVKMSSSTVLAVLYMVIYMRTSPNLEGAIRFASENLKGPLAWDLKKLLWDMEVGSYKSADEAISYYVEKWKDKNREFSESLHLLRSTAVEPARREDIFNETVKVILNGTRERTRHYAAGMRMPMMLVHAMGILLPVMGLVMFPVVLIFMADAVKPYFIVFGYNVALPVTLYFFMSHIVSTKPVTFSQPDISMAKNTPPIGKFRISGRDIPIWPIAIIFGLPLLGFGLLGLSSLDVFTSVNYSIAIIAGLAISIIVFGYLDSFQKIKIRNDIERIEDEFSVALFQLGNQISGGTPIELAIDKAADNLKEMKISDLFRITSMNMKKFNYTFEQALFDKDIGAIWYYPSNLIQSIMKAVVESSRKSLTSAATSMVIISRYLKDVHDVKEEINEMLGETISSMKFLAMFLAPLVAGVTVTMAVIIMQILTSLGATLGSLFTEGSSNAAQGLLLTPWAMSGAPPISPAEFQLVVGIYMLQVAFLLTIFLNKIQYGEDAIGERYLLTYTILFALIIYIASWFTVYTMFGGPISGLLTMGVS